MKRCPVSLLVYFLALTPGTLLFSGCTGAIPATQHAATVTTGLTPEPHTGNPQQTATPETGPAGSPARQYLPPAASHDCRQEVAGGAPTGQRTTGMPCANPADVQQRLSFQFGRRAGTGDDILGVFDGVRVDYRPGDALNLKGIAGYPVVADGDEFNTTRQVFGISAATKPFARAWDLNSYLIEQQVNGQADSRSFGGALRYLQPGRSLLFYLEYDAAGDSLGTLMASGAWKLPFKTTLNATLDRRNRAPGGRQQKYLQQSMKATSGWNWVLPTDRLAHYTSNGSGEVSSLGVGLSHALSKRISLIGDFAVLDTANNAMTDAAPAVQSSEYFYHLKLTGKDLVVAGDHNRFDLRHNVTGTNRKTSVAVDSKYAINRFWKVMPRLRADYHSPLLENAQHWVTSPAVKMEYRRNEQSGFHIEAGGNWSTAGNTDADDSGSPYFVNMKYQAKF